MVRLLFLCVLLAVGAYLCLADGGQSIMRPDIHLCPEAVIVKKCVKKCNWSIKKKAHECEDIKPLGSIKIPRDADGIHKDMYDEMYGREEHEMHERDGGYSGDSGKTDGSYSGGSGKTDGSYSGGSGKTDGSYSGSGGYTSGGDMVDCEPDEFECKKCVKTPERQNPNLMFEDGDKQFVKYTIEAKKMCGDKKNVFVLKGKVCVFVFGGTTENLRVNAQLFKKKVNKGWNTAVAVGDPFHLPFDEFEETTDMLDTEACDHRCFPFKKVLWGEECPHDWIFFLKVVAEADNCGPKEIEKTFVPVLHEMDGNDCLIINDCVKLKDFDEECPACLQCDCSVSCRTTQSGCPHPLDSSGGCGEVSNCEIEKKICCSSEFTICKRFKLNQQEGCCMPARSGQSSRSDFTDTLKNTAKLFKPWWDYRVIAKDSAAVDINVKCDAAPSPPPPGRVCVRSHGYFKNHPQVITNTVITVANQKCDWFPDDVEGIIRTIKQLEGGNALEKLAGHFTTALLNVGSGADSECISYEITEACEILKKNSGDTGNLGRFTNTFDKYNNGQLCAPKCR